MDLVVGLSVYFVISAFCFWCVYWVLKSDLGRDWKVFIVFVVIVAFFSLKVTFENDGEEVMRLNAPKEVSQEQVEKP
jgi:hypothetical protein